MNFLAYLLTKLHFRLATKIIHTNWRFLKMCVIKQHISVFWTTLYNRDSRRQHFTISGVTANTGELIGMSHPLRAFKDQLRCIMQIYRHPVSQIMGIHPVEVPYYTSPVALSGRFS